MSKKLFSNKDIEILSENKYVKKVSEKGITYTDEFKRLFIAENEKGKVPRDIFAECGFDIDIIGLKRIKASGSRWRFAFRRNGIEQLQDTRKFNTGRSTKKRLVFRRKVRENSSKTKTFTSRE